MAVSDGYGSRHQVDAIFRRLAAGPHVLVVFKDGKDTPLQRVAFDVRHVHKFTTICREDVDLSCPLLQGAPGRGPFFRNVVWRGAELFGRLPLQCYQCNCHLRCVFQHHPFWDLAHHCREVSQQHVEGSS